MQFAKVLVGALLIGTAVGVLIFGALISDGHVTSSSVLLSLLMAMAGGVLARNGYVRSK
jgi:hypothetical protein